MYVFTQFQLLVFSYTEGFKVHILTCTCFTVNTSRAFWT